MCDSSTEVRMQCEEFHGSVSARVAEGPVKRIHWIPLRRGWVCVGQRAGVRLWSWVIRWVASWGLPRQPPACLPAAKITDTHSHTYKEYAQRYSPSTRFMHRKEDSRQIAWGFLRELPGWLVSRKPQSQISVKLALDQAYSCLLRSKNKESATECYGIFANNILKRQLEAQFNCHFKKWHWGATVLEDYNLCVHTKRGARSSEIQLQSEMKERLKTCLICKTSQLTAHGLISTSSSFKANLVADLFISELFFMKSMPQKSLTTTCKCQNS